jgi:hypothetical protein
MPSHMAWDANFYENLGCKKPVAKFLRDLSVKARAKCMKYIAMLETHGFALPSRLLKK